MNHQTNKKNRTIVWFIGNPSRISRLESKVLTMNLYKCNSYSMSHCIKMQLKKIIKTQSYYCTKHNRLFAIELAFELTVCIDVSNQFDFLKPLDYSSIIKATVGKLINLLSKSVFIICFFLRWLCSINCVLMSNKWTINCPTSIYVVDLLIENDFFFLRNMFDTHCVLTQVGLNELHKKFFA